MKRYLSLFLAILLVASVVFSVQFTASAVDTDIAETSAIIDDYTYTVLPDGTAEITGYYGWGTNIVIPSSLDGYKVTSIGEVAFERCYDLVEVIIPEGVTNISNNAFSDCGSLEKITIPDTVTSIGIGAFCWCYSLQEIDIPQGVTAIPDAAFHMCYSLRRVSIPEGVVSLGFSSFDFCSSLTQVVLPESVTSIGEFSFYGCTNLREIIIPENVKNIDSETFGDCENLEAIYVYSKDCALESSNIPVTTTVYCYEGSTAQAYAESNGNPFVLFCADAHTVVVDNGYAATYDSEGLTDGLHCSDCGAVLKEQKIIPVLTNNPADFSYEVLSDGTAEITGYSGSALCLTIPSVLDGYKVTSIGNDAFISCYSLIEVTIPDGVTNIGDRAFSSCSDLIELRIPDGVINIGMGAFSECFSLENITIPETVTNIGEAAFSWCESITEIAIPQGVKIIADFTFSSCVNLKEITLPEGITAIGFSAFDYCMSLENVVLPETITSIGEFAFCDCYSITEIIIPENVEFIGYEAFGNCMCLETMYVYNKDCTFDSCNIPTTTTIHCYKYSTAQAYAESNGNPYILLAEDNSHSEVVVKGYDATCESAGLTDGVYCSECNEVLVEQVTIPAKGHTEVIDKGVAPGCETAGLTQGSHCFVCGKVLQKQEVISATGHSFGEWIVSKEPTFSEDGEKVRYCSGCDEFESVRIPKRQEGHECNFTGEVIVKKAPTCTEGGVKIVCCYDPDCPEYESVSILATGHNEEIDYGVDPECESTGLTQGLHCTECGEVLVKQEVISATGHTAVVDKGYEATYGKDGLTDGSHCSVCGKILAAQETIPALTVNPADFAYEILPDGTVEITEYTGSETHLSIPSTLYGYKVTGIGENAFLWCDSLIDITIPDGVTYIGDYAFKNCQNLERITIPESVTSIGMFAFGYCYNLEEIILPENVTYIGSCAFWDCSTLKEILIPEGITIINDGTFNGCATLTKVTLPEGVTSIGDNAFYRCEFLSEITIPERVTSIGDLAFWGCISLTEITIPENVEIVGYDAFHDCTSLETMYIYSRDCAIALESIPSTIIIYCYEDSTAHDYAYSNGNSYALLDYVDTMGLIYEVLADGTAEITGYAGLATSLDIPSTLDGYLVTSIGVDAFAYCYSLEKITIPDTVSIIGVGAFAWCANLTNINIPEGVTIISDSAFHDCGSLKEIVIPEGVTSTGLSSFDYCTNLVKVTLPESIGIIGEFTFYGCSNLKEIIIPKNVTSVGFEALGDCANLETIYVYSKDCDFEYSSISSETTIYCFEDSTAHSYAESNGISYILFCADGHTEVDGVCSVCGKKIDTNSKVEGHSISLGDNVAVNYYLTIDDSIVNDEKAEIVFTLPGDIKLTVSVKDALVTDEGYFVFTCELNALQMTETVYAQVVASGYESEVYSYSVIEYAKSILKAAEDGNATYADAVPLVKAMLNYGANAQIHFGYNTDNLANSILSDEDKALEDVKLNAYKPEITGSEAGVKHYGISLTLNSETELNIYFAIEDAENMPEFFVNGESATLQKVGDLYRIKIADIPAQNLDKEYVVTVGGLTVKYSPLSYGYMAMSTQSETVKNVIRALYAYNQAANVYSEK